MTFIERHWHFLPTMSQGDPDSGGRKAQSMAGWLKVSELGIRIQQPDICRNVKEFSHGALRAWIVLISCCWQGLLTGNRCLYWFPGFNGLRCGNICQWATEARHLLIKLGMIASPRAKSNRTFLVFAIASYHCNFHILQYTGLWFTNTYRSSGNYWILDMGIENSVWFSSYL